MPLEIKENVECPLCRADASFAYSLPVLHKYEALYYLCPACDLFFAYDPFWLKEAYATAIADADTGLVARNLVFARILSVLLARFGYKKAAALDYAGGSGLLVRLMRDRGFDFYWEDPYAKNEFARGFGIEEHPEIAPRVMTAFEVFEHMPVVFDLLESGFVDYGVETIFFSTELKEQGIPAKDWWYLSVETGQHISFYSKKTCEYMASKLGLRFARGGKIHVFTKHKRIPSFYPLFSGRLAYAFLPLAWKKSLTSDDNSLLLNKIKSQ